MIVKPTAVAPTTSQVDGEAGPAPAVSTVKPSAPIAQEAAPPAAAAPPPPVSQEAAPPAAAAPPPPVSQEAAPPAAAAPPPPVSQEAAPPTAAAPPSMPAAPSATTTAGNAEAPEGPGRRGRPPSSDPAGKDPNERVPLQLYLKRSARDELGVIRIRRGFSSTNEMLMHRIDDILEEEGEGRLCGTTRTRKG
ncbi:MAG: hypothetical protein IBJ15_05015 [Alphaproteobacteria bacterium]|nr:hypothetical protein [Alphaproteobacteria bacterium]